MKETSGDQSAVQGGLHGPSPILGPDGQPLPRRKDLVQELAAPTLTGVRAFWSGSVASGLTPDRLAGILKASIDGDHRTYLSLAEEMEERDPHYASVLGTRKRALAGIAPIIDANSRSKSDEKIADTVEELIGDPMISDLVIDMQDALGKGYSVTEIIWKEYKGQWWPARYEFRDPKFFTFDHISRSDIRLASDAGGDGEALPPAKFIRHVPKLKSGIAIRSGLARLVAWSYCFKMFDLKDWAAFMDVFGMPLRVGKYHPNATADEKRALLRAVSQIAADAAAIIPESMMIEFVEAKGFADKPFENLARYLDEQVSKAVLGQTMTTDAGASLAQAKMHNEVRLDILEFDADQAAKTINRDLVAWFVALNFGADKVPPRIAFPVPKPEDIKAISEAVAKLVPLGLRVKQEEMRDKFGLSEPDAGDEILMPQQHAAPPAATGEPDRNGGDATDRSPDDAGGKRPALNAALRCSCAHCRALNYQPSQAQGFADQLETDLDDIAAAALEDWDAQLKPARDAILLAARQANTYGEFLHALDTLFATLDMPDLERNLLLAQLKARGLQDG